MMKPVIHFAHANGIPPQTYTKLLNVLAQDYHIIYSPIIGMNPQYPITDQWPHLVEELRDSINRQAHGQKVILLGHSLGSLLSLMLAKKYPELVHQVIMLDPPLIIGWKSFLFHLAKKSSTNWVDKITPAGLSAKRRDHWDSSEDAALRLRSRGFFKDFDEECFQAYIDYGLQEDVLRGGVCLTIPKQVEVDIFRATPSCWWLPQPELKVPVHLIVGKDSVFYKKGFPQLTQRKWKIPYTVMSGGHMFPLEYPLQVAEKIKSYILLT